MGTILEMYPRWPGSVTDGVRPLMIAVHWSSLLTNFNTSCDGMQIRSSVPKAAHFFWITLDIAISPGPIYYSVTVLN